MPPEERAKRKKRLNVSGRTVGKNVSKGVGAPAKPPLPFSSSGRKPSVAIVGAGRLGLAMALALGETGYEVVALVTGSANGARHATKLTGTVKAVAIEKLKKLPSIDLLFITTPDDAIVEVAELVSSISSTSESVTHSSRAGGRRRVAIHASGALSSDVLEPLRAAGYSIGSMHPLVSVSDPSIGADALRSAFYCVEGDDEAVRAARRVVRDLGGRSFTIESRHKSLYHAAAVMTAGHTVALFDTAVRLLLSCGLSESRARTVLLPLLRSTLENLSTLPPSRALTGTFSRADVATVKKHLAALERFSAAGDVYSVLGLRSLDLAREAGADAAALQRIKSILKKPRQ